MSSDQPKSLPLRQVAPWTLLDIVDTMNAGVYGDVGTDAQLAATFVTGAAIDSRTVTPGAIFVALQGTQSHGLEHAKQAFANGAVAVVTGTDLDIDDDRWNDLVGEAMQHGPIIVAGDCDGMTAIGRLGRAWRRHAGFTVVGITGSSGKTSTKDLLASLLRAHGANVVASHANWNNEIGVPLTLLTAPVDSHVVIVEMGMRGIGQIDYLCDIAAPDIGIVTNAGTAHLELLGTVESIVAAKAELLAGTFTGGTAIFPANQPEIAKAAKRVPDRALMFAAESSDEAIVAVTSVERSNTGIRGQINIAGAEFDFDLPVYGLHNAANLAAASSALLAIMRSVDAIEPAAFTEATITEGRGDRHHLAQSRIVIDDSYNANPESMQAALTELAEIAAADKRIAVLGHMAELGPTSPQLHAGVGEFAASLPAIDELVVVGDGELVEAMAAEWASARSASPLRFDTVDAAIDQLPSLAAPGTAMLVKASNSAALCRLAAAAVERYTVMHEIPAETNT